ncbi:MAG TPA: metallophosphoesterase family protein, partial [Gaiellales bacterium]|nr:metallophosphoesterase family protein [Gaiellales bacterium]
MRVAAIYDIHGNLPALDAVLEQIAEEEPDVVLVGGDSAAGPMPAATLDRLIALGCRARYIRGNADRELVDPSSGDDIWARRARWAAASLTAAHRELLTAASLRVVLDVEGLGRTLFCHGSPRSDEEIITRLTPEARLRPMLEGVDADIVVCGHTHVQFDRRVAGKRIVNAGSVGMPYEGDPGARWAMLGPDVSLWCTDYD